MEAIAATTTPFKMPSKSTPTNAIAATVNSSRLMRHNRPISPNLTSPVIATNTIAAHTAFGKFLKNPVKKSKQNASVIEAKISDNGVLAPGVPAVHRAYEIGPTTGNSEQTWNLGNGDDESGT